MDKDDQRTESATRWHQLAMQMVRQPTSREGQRPARKTQQNREYGTAENQSRSRATATRLSSRENATTEKVAEQRQASAGRDAAEKQRPRAERQPLRNGRDTPGQRPHKSG